MIFIYIYNIYLIFTCTFAPFNNFTASDLIRVCDLLYSDKIIKMLRSSVEPMYQKMFWYIGHNLYVTLIYCYLNFVVMRTTNFRNNY